MLFLDALTLVHTHAHSCTLAYTQKSFTFEISFRWFPKTETNLRSPDGWAKGRQRDSHELLLQPVLVWKLPNFTANTTITYSYFHQHLSLCPTWLESRTHSIYVRHSREWQWQLGQTQNKWNLLIIHASFTITTFFFLLMPYTFYFVFCFCYNVNSFVLIKFHNIFLYLFFSVVKNTHIYDNNQFEWYKSIVIFFNLNKNVCRFVAVCRNKYCHVLVMISWKCLVELFNYKHDNNSNNK